MDKKPYLTFAEALDQYITASESPEGGVPTGYSIDDDLGLMNTGELALLWARSGAGKSTLLLNFIANTPDVPTVFFNMEMRARTMAEWLATMTTDLGVTYHNLRRVIEDGDRDQFHAEVMERLRELRDMRAPQVWMSEQDRPSVDDLARTVDQIEADTGIRPVRVMIDHLGLMMGTRDYEGTTAMGAELHKWAQQDELLVMVAQQTGRSGGPSGERNDGHVPVTLSSGVFGGEHDADWILGAWRPERNPQFRKSRAEFKKDDDYLSMLAERKRVRGQTVLAVVKNRPFGDLNEDGILLHWNNETRRLEEMA